MLVLHEPAAYGLVNQTWLGGVSTTIPRFIFLLHSPPMGVFLFYTAGIGFALGLFTYSLVPLQWADIVWVFLVGFVLAVLWRRARLASAAPFLLVLSVALIAGGLGLVRMQVAETQLAAPTLAAQVGEEVSLRGEVVREPDVRANTTQLIVETSSGRILVRADRHTPVRYGDVIEVTGELAAPSAFETELGRTFDYPGYLHARGITHTISFAEVTVRAEGRGNPVVAALLSFKQSLIDSFSRVISEPEAGLGAGLLLGVKQALGEDLETAFRKTGIIHIVVLSGYNVMIVAEAIMRLLAVFLSVRTRVVIGLIAIAGFAVMVGLSPTVLRATLMAGLVLLARATGRTYLVLRALVFAGVAMLLINPYLLVFDPGFQLSFLATLGLILIAPQIETRLHLVPTRLQVREFLTATVATQIFVLPLLLYSIGEFSVVSVLVNVLVLPMVPVAMGLAFLTGLVGFVSTAVALYVGVAAHYSLTYIVVIAQWFGNLPFAAYVVPPFPFWGVVLAYAALGYLAYRTHPGESAADEYNSAVANWVIEEEEDAKAAASSLQKDEAAAVPIFFR